LYSPVPVVVTRTKVLVAVLVMFTTTLGMGAPALSVTVPVMVPRSPCAIRENASVSEKTQIEVIRRNNIVPLPRAVGCPDCADTGSEIIIRER
jgi:hypothetical protein